MPSLVTLQETGLTLDSGSQPPAGSLVPGGPPPPPSSTFSQVTQPRHRRAGGCGQPWGDELTAPEG